MKYHLNKVLEKKEENTKKDYDFFVVVEEYIKEMKGDSRLSPNYLKTLVNSLSQIKIYIKEDLKRTYFPLGEIDCKYPFFQTGLKC